MRTIEYGYDETTGKKTKIRGTLADGTKVEYYDNGKIRYKKSTDGAIYWYYENGNPKRECLPDESERTWYENGNLETKILPDGTMCQWYENGKRKLKTLPSGAEYTWYKNGYLSSQYIPLYTDTDIFIEYKNNEIEFLRIFDVYTGEFTLMGQEAIDYFNSLKAVYPKYFSNNDDDTTEPLERYDQTSRNKHDTPAVRPAEDFLTPEAKRQMDSVRKKYEGTAMWLKAPNGEKSNLDERQWLAVRTPNFKAWFGDWEAAHIVEKVRDFLENSEAVGSISGEEFSKTDTPLVDRVMEYYKNTGNTVVHNKELGDVTLDRRGIKDSAAHGLGKEKSAAFALVPDVIRNGFIYDRQNRWKGRNYSTATLIANVKIGGKDYVCEVVVKQSENKQGFYLHEVEVKANLDGVFKTALNDGTLSRSRLIISQYAGEAKNSSKILDENGEPLVVYHGTDETFSIFDRTKSRANMDIQGMFFSPWEIDAGGYGSNLMPVFLNIKKPASEAQGYRALNLFKGQNNSGVKAREYLIARGFDGVNNSNEEFIAFHSNQIKSATRNNGNFSTTNNEIYAQAAKLHDNPLIERYPQAMQAHSFNNPDIEQRYRKNQKAAAQSGTLHNIKQSMKEFLKGFRGDFPLLAGKEAREKGLIPAREYLRLMNRNLGAATHMAMVQLYDNLHGLNAEQYDIFSRLMLLNDLRILEANYKDKNGNPLTELPFGFTHETLETAYEQFLTLAEEDEAISNAIKTEDENNAKARQTLANTAAKFGMKSFAKRISSNDLFLVRYARLLGKDGDINEDISSNYIVAMGDMWTMMLQDAERLNTLGKIAD